MSSQSSKNVGELLQSAHDEGLLSTVAYQTLNVVDIGQQIQAGLGVHVDDVTASEVLLVTIMPDDSGSIRFAQNAQAVRDGHNLVLEALKESKQKDSILVHTRYLNGNVLYPYRALEDCLEMDRSNYNPDQGTPLYDQSVVLLGTVLTKTQEFADNGVPVRSVTLLITDGSDQHSVKQTAARVKSVADSMLKAENHIIAAMGVDDGSGYTDFRQVFKEMGIPDEWVLTPGNTASEIRKAFQVFSQSAVYVSQGAQSFSKSALKGFGGN
jgi:hypothetical protein